ncbi:MAG: hypothetical protein KJN78_04320 [Gammaproteobacteria bacterium]|nr:hypothetical protein [Gammaproteobacteria bacterium]
MIISGSENGLTKAELCARYEGQQAFFTNSASVTGSCRAAGEGVSAVSATASDIAVIDCDPYLNVDPEITIEKSTNGDDADTAPGPSIAVGLPVTWDYVVTNTGEVPLTIESVLDDREGAVTCDTLELGAGESTDCNAISGVALGGQYENMATVTATAVNGKRASDTDPSHYLGLAPSIDLVKTAEPLIFTAEDTISYTFVVTNDGSVPLTDVALVDDLDGLQALQCPQTTLDVGEDMTCTAAYPIGQVDVDRQFVENTADVTGLAPDESTVTDQDSAIVRTTPDFDLNLIKSADPEFYENEGDEISYSYLVTNSGNQTLYPPYSVSDNKIEDGAVTCPQPAELAPDASINCVATYTIGADDITARSVTNVATATAFDAADGGNEVDSNPDDETVNYRGIVADLAAFCVNDAPWASFSYELFGFPDATPGDVSYSWINVGQDLVLEQGALSAISGYLIWPGATTSGPAGLSPPAGPIDPAWPIGTGWPGWTQDPVTGEWTESPTPARPELELRLTIGPSTGQTLQYPLPSEECAAQPKAVIQVEKSVSSVESKVDGSLDVQYRITVRNVGAQSGTYDLSDILLVDEALPSDQWAWVEAPSYVPGSEASQTGTILQPDVGEFVTGATLVTGEDLAANRNESFVFKLNFGINMDDLTAEGANCATDDDAGGKTGLTNHVDVLVDGQVVDSDEACGRIPLQPSLAVLKQIKNGAGWEDADEAADALVRKHPSGAEYRIIIRNTGLVALTDVLLSDELEGLVLADDFPVGTIAAGDETVVGSGQLSSLLVSEACDESGTFRNTASVTATAEGNSVSDEDDAWLKCVGTPDITLVKQIDVGNGWKDADTAENAAGPVQAPSGASYRMIVTNSGDVDLVGVTVEDGMIPGSPYTVGALDVGQTVTVTEQEWPGLLFDTDPETDNLPVCSGPGLIMNSAEAVGTSVENADDTDQDTDKAYLVCIGDPMISILKEVSIDGGPWEPADGPDDYPSAVYGDGDVPAEYRLIVANIGDVRLTGVEVNDPTLGVTAYVPMGASGPGILEPDEVIELYFADIPALQVDNICPDPGQHTNVATVTGVSDAGASDTDTDSATVECFGVPAIRVLKEVSTSGQEGTYQPVELETLAPSDAYYRITVENVGNVALENVEVNDPLLSFSVTVGNLALDETVVLASGQYTGLFVADACDLGPIFTNTATATGKSAESTQTVEDDDLVTLVCNEPVLICDGPDGELGRKPSYLKMVYDGTFDTDNSQGAADIINPDITGPMPSTIRAVVYDKPGGKRTVELDEILSIGESFLIGPWWSNGTIPPNILIEFYDVDTGVIVQSVQFHGSCSEPLVVGDEFGGATIIGYTP